MTTGSRSRHTFFLGVTPRLEDVLEEEVHDLGMARSGAKVRGGLEVAADLRGLWRMVHHLRVAESVRVRLGTFPAPNFAALRAELLRLPWAAYFSRGSEPQVRVVSHASALYHQRAVAERARQWIAERLAPAEGRSPPPAVSVVHLRLHRNIAQVSVDAAGELLHRRGYRTRVGRAPLRETLAAACLRLAGHGPGGRIWDPFCGSGSLVIEGAGISLERPASISERRFAFESWPIHDAVAYASYREDLRPADAGEPVCFGSDLSDREVTAAVANAESASLDAACAFAGGDFETVAPRIPAGVAVVSNPPYGHRTGPVSTLEETFARFGSLLRRRADLRPVHILSGHPRFARATGLRWDEVRRFRNRGLTVSLLRLR